MREIWRYDGDTVRFYERAGDEYREVSESPSFLGFTPTILADALEQSRPKDRQLHCVRFAAAGGVRTIGELKVSSQRRNSRKSCSTNRRRSSPSRSEAA